MGARVDVRFAGGAAGRGDEERGVLGAAAPSRRDAVGDLGTRKDTE